jgi:hypothetical protein
MTSLTHVVRLRVQGHEEREAEPDEAGAEPAALNHLRGSGRRKHSVVIKIYTTTARTRRRSLSSNRRGWVEGGARECLLHEGISTYTVAQVSEAPPPPPPFPSPTMSMPMTTSKVLMAMCCCSRKDSQCMSRWQLLKTRSYTM